MHSLALSHEELTKQKNGNTKYLRIGNRLNYKKQTWGDVHRKSKCCINCKKANYKMVC